MQNMEESPLPEKVVRRHGELAAALLPEIDKQVAEHGHAADSLLNNLLRTHKELGSRDRRFLSQAVFSYFRWRGWTRGKLGLDPVEACLLGAALDSTGLPESFRHLEARCTLPFTVETMGHLSVEAKRDALNEKLHGRPGFQPLELADLVVPGFAGLVDPALAERLVAAFQQRPPAWMRARTDPALLVEALADRGVPCRVHEQVTAAVAVEGGVNLAQALAPYAAQFVVQDIASQCVGLACAPQEGEEWWDCCAGSGGKALHLMDLMRQKGKVLATDLRAAALRELKKRAHRHGIRHIRTQPFNAVNDEPFRKSFDGVLVDAPCSGWGTWARNPDARWRSSAKEVVPCAARQVKILGNAAWCVKPGGALVYAVCTCTRPETEEVVMNFLDQNPRFKPDPFPNPLTGETAAGSLQIWPWDGPGDAMFIARFVRGQE